MAPNLKNAKDKVDQILAQAKESVKVLEALQKEGVNRVRSMLQGSSNEKVLSSLKKIGLASRAEVRELEKRVEELASELRAQINQVQKASRKTQKTGKSTEHDANV